MLSFVFRYLMAFCVLMLGAMVAYAHGIGEVAQNMLEPVTMASKAVSDGAIVIGSACLFSSFLKYRQYRVNHLAVPISTVFLLLVAGIVLICLPLIYKLTEYGIPFSYSLK